MKSRLPAFLDKDKICIICEGDEEFDYLSRLKELGVWNEKYEVFLDNADGNGNLVFTAKEGPAVATSLIDLGDRFRLIINDVNCKKTEKPMPKLPVATAFWTPEPNLQTGAEAWILAGGAHHTAFSYDLTAEQMGDWAAYMGIEAVYIDKDTTIRQFKNELLWNSVAFRK